MSSKKYEYRKNPLVGMLVCGIIIIAIGIYLTISNELAIGRSFSKRSFGGMNVISGSWAIVIGVALAAFPAYILIRNRRKKDH